MGCKVTGIDILENKIENAKTYYQNHPLKENLELIARDIYPVSYTHLRAHETVLDLVCRLLLEQKNKQ